MGTLSVPKTTLSVVGDVQTAQREFPLSRLPLQAETPIEIGVKIPLSAQGGSALGGNPPLKRGR